MGETHLLRPGSIANLTSTCNLLIVSWSLAGARQFHTHAHLLPSFWPSLSPSSTQNLCTSYSSLRNTTAQSPSLVHTKYDFSRGQQSPSTDVSEEPAQRGLQKQLRLAPTSTPGPLPEYLKSQEAPKPLPSSAGSEPTSSTRPYLSANFIADAAAKASPAVVNITVSSGEPTT